MINHAESEAPNAEQERQPKSETNVGKPREASNSPKEYPEFTFVFDTFFSTPRALIRFAPIQINVCIKKRKRENTFPLHTTDTEVSNRNSTTNDKKNVQEYTQSSGKAYKAVLFT